MARSSLKSVMIAGIDDVSWPFIFTKGSGTGPSDHASAQFILTLACCHEFQFPLMRAARDTVGHGSHPCLCKDEIQV